MSLLPKISRPKSHINEEISVDNINNNNNLRMARYLKMIQSFKGVLDTYGPLDIKQTYDTDIQSSKSSGFYEEYFS